MSNFSTLEKVAAIVQGDSWLEGKAGFAASVIYLVLDEKWQELPKFSTRRVWDILKKIEFVQTREETAAAAEIFSFGDQPENKPVFYGV